MEKIVKKINMASIRLPRPLPPAKPFELLNTEYEATIMTFNAFKKKYYPSKKDFDQDDFIKKLENNCTTYKTKSNLNFIDPDIQVDGGYIEDKFEYVLKKKKRYKMLLVVYTGESRYPSDETMKKISKEAWGKKRWLEKRLDSNNPLNRIFAFVIFDEKPCLCNFSKSKTKKNTKKKTKTKKAWKGGTIVGTRRPYGKMLSVSIICGSPFSRLTDQGGIGAYLMLFVIMYAREKKCRKVILEVTNSEAEIPIDEPNIINNEKDDDNDDDDDPFWKIPRYYPYKKCKKSWDYMDEIDEDEDEEEWDNINLEDREYGGDLYQKGRDSTAGLYCKVYEQWGFVEDSKLNTMYKCFDISPLPAMVLNLPEHSNSTLFRALINGNQTFKQSKYCSKKYPNFTRRKVKKRKRRSRRRKKLL